MRGVKEIGSLTTMVIVGDVAGKLTSGRPVVRNNSYWHSTPDKARNGFSARFISGVAIYHCVGARDARRDRALEARFSSGGADTVRSLRVDPHEPNGGGWFHADTFCLSTLEAGLS
jgi:hypothetical protein